MSKFRKIVENILEEDAYKDKNRLLDAMRAYEEVVTDLENNTKGKPFVIDIAGDTTSEIKTKYGRLVVVFSLEPELALGDNTAGLYLSGHSYIQINIPTVFNLENELISDVHPKSKEPLHALPSDLFLKLIDTKQMQQVFIHEYTHYVDDITTISLAKINNSKKNKDASYFNNTNELNAHHIEWLFKISTDLVDKYGRRMKELTPEEKLDFLRTQWKEDEQFVKYYNQLSPEYKKKFIKRLYNYLSMQ